MKLLKKSAAKTVSILLSFVMILSLFTVIPVPVQAAEVCTDILTVDDIGATGTNYVNWTARSGENHTSIGSAAVYSGNSAKGNGGIQLRSKSQSGVVTTVSGGIVRKITVAWVDTDRNNDRYLDVYGSNTAYSSAADLYSDARGTLLGTFFYNDASYNEADGVHYSEVEVSGEYSFFGFRSQKDALYLSSVTVDWEISDVNRVWNWAADYSSATCTFTDESESHTEDAAITSEVTKQPSYLAEGVLTHTATVIYNGVTYRDVQTEPIDKPEFGGSVPYIDENGGLTDSPAGTQLLTGNEGNLSGGWYTFAADTSVDNLTFSGDVRLVLCDGVTVSSNGKFTVNGTLTVYGQSTNSGILAGIASGGNTIIGGSGNLIINGGSYRWVGKSGYGYVEICAGGLTVNGGSFTNCNLSADNFVTVNGGTVNNDENTRISCPNGTVTVNGGDIHLRSDGSAVDCGSFVFGGGSFGTEGGRDGVVYSHDKSVTLNWTNESDSIYVGQYGFWQYIGGDTYRFDGFNMTLQKNFIDQDGAKYPAGTYFSDDLRYKTLRPDVDRWNQLQQEINASDSGDVIRLTSDCIAAPDDSALVVPEEKDDLTIDLNGYTIDRGLADKDAVTGGNVITNSGTLVLTGGGTVTGGKNTSNGGAIVNNGGLVILDTTISGNTTTKDGGAIYNSGMLTLNGTTITSNSAGSGTSGSGGAISAHAGTITIVDAEITDNTAASHGGAIYLGTKDGKSATLNLEGGTITGNTAGNQGGGILHIGILNVKGSPAVYENTAPNGNNIYLRPSKLINVTGTLSSYLNLGVTRENGATDVFTSNLSSNGTHESFFSDNPDFYIADNGSGEALLQRYYVFSFDANGGSGTQEPIRSTTNSANLPECTFDAPENAVFVAWNDNGTLKRPGDSVSIESGYTKTIAAVFKPVTPYVNANGEDMTPVIAGRIGEGAAIWAEKWLFVDSELTISNRVTVQGEVNLILCDGAVLNVPKGITVNGANDSNLTIWCQKNCTGTLNITGPEDGNAGIGGIRSDSSSTSNECGGGIITINGGIINAVGTGNGGSGIGTGYFPNYADACTITINGGTVTAEGRDNYSAGIGCKEGEITITGGVVNATGYDYAPGIGITGKTQYIPEQLTITISGGKITAAGGCCAAGIGGLVNCGGGTITISDGDVTAIGGGRMDNSHDPNDPSVQNSYAGAGIGSCAAVNNYYTLQTVINITGGKVNAKGGYEKDFDISAAPGIGIGEVREGLSGGSGDAVTSLTWTDDSMETMSVTSNGYNGSVTLDQTFVDNNGEIYYGEIDDTEILEHTTLRPCDDMGVTLAGHSVSLEGDIAVNFYMELTSEILSHTGVYMQFTVPDTSEEYRDQKVYVSDLTPVTLDDNTYYLFKCRVAAKNMTSEIQAQLIDGDNHSIIYTYSVREYADYLLAHASSQGTDEEKAWAKAAPLVEKMLQYGEYAKAYFDDTALDDIADVEIPSKFADFTSSLPDEHTYACATLSLKSETTLSLYFTKDRTLSDISCVDKDGIARTVQTKTTDSYQIIRIRNIAAMELQDAYTISFKINGTAHSITYSPMNYCCKVLNGSTENPNLQKLVKALYQYSQAATLYFGQEG